MARLVPILLSGGSGSRLWPVSRALHPKQFLCFDDSDESLLQNAVRRMETYPGAQPPIVVCNNENRFLIAEHCRRAGSSPGRIILEPCARNTAPAIALGALCAQEMDDDPILLVQPTDHRLPDLEVFFEALDAAVPLASQGKIVTFGVTPTRAETGYGYIERGDQVPGGDAYLIDRFIEKPSGELAAGLAVSGRHYWNCGIFVFRCSTYLEELRLHAPEVHAACTAAYAGKSTDLDFERVDADSFSRSPNISIDYAVMEHTARGVVVPLPCNWSDVGSWASLWETLDKDSAGNVMRGDVLAQDVSNCYLQSERRLMAAIGVERLVVVDTEDALLVSSLDRTQEVREIVSVLKSADRPEALCHKTVYRPWGSYHELLAADRFKVKLILVKPGAGLSLQMHHHRAEHWVVVKGTAKVTRGDDTFLLSENESTYIPLGTRHRLQNPGMVELELVEVQSGAYLGEDDIIRFSDDYGRDNT